VDLTLVELSSGKEIPMPTEFDDFSGWENYKLMDLSFEELEKGAI